MPGAYTYDYPRPAVTADVAVLRLDKEPEILLIQRKFPPFQEKWALPGGFMEMEETLEETARR
ncbi:MAG: NUDIX hydrolase, partial [Bacteroidales bacterium]|nr:NUDIX hydrolase [Bacteroidales bacterium]